MLGRRDRKGDILQVGIKKGEKKLFPGNQGILGEHFWDGREAERRPASCEGEREHYSRADGY